jgi:hypothetical protein
MIAHTPGPWLYRPCPHDDWGYVRSQDDSLVAVARAGRAVSEEEYAAHRRAKTDPYEPNARLITAAPDLLAALERLVRVTAILPPAMDQPGSPMEQARAAIAKARGRLSDTKE